MNGTKKFNNVCFLLILTSILTLFFGCAKTDDNNSPTTANANENSTTQNANNADTENELKPDLSAKDMGGKTFRILVQDFGNYAPLDMPDVYVEELTGEAVNDEAYNRNLYMEQTYNCKVEAVVFPHQDDAMNSLKKSITSGDGLYDFAMMRSCSFLTAITSGYLTDLYEVPSLDFEKPWWDKKTMDALSVVGKNYAICSDVTVGHLLTTWNVYFNKKFITDFGLENPYPLVKDGTWTIDKMYEMGKVVASDLNDDGKRTVDDRYGVTHILDGVVGLLNSFGVRLVDTNEQGEPYLSFDGEDAYNKFIHIAELFSDKDTFFNAHLRSSPANDYEAGMFVNSQALFSLGGIYYGAEMRAMQEDFGILPYPKYDVNQQNYYTGMTTVAIPLLTIPVTNTDLENTGIFLEDYAYQGYKRIRPAFYEMLLQRKVARDDESQDMLDFIFDNIFIDIGAIYNFGGIFHSLDDLGSNGNTNVAAFMEKNTNKIQKDIDKLVASVSSNE